MVSGEDLGAKRKAVRAELIAITVPGRTLRDLVDERIDKVHQGTDANAAGLADGLARARALAAGT